MQWAAPHNFIQIKRQSYFDSSSILKDTMMSLSSLSPFYKTYYNLTSLWWKISVRQNTEYKIGKIEHKWWRLLLQKQYQNFLTKHPDGRISRGSFHDMMKVLKWINKSSWSGLYIWRLWHGNLPEVWLNIFFVGMLPWDWHRKAWASHIQNVWYKRGESLKIHWYRVVFHTLIFEGRS